MDSQNQCPPYLALSRVVLETKNPSLGIPSQEPRGCEPRGRATRRLQMPAAWKFSRSCLASMCKASARRMAPTEDLDRHSILFMFRTLREACQES